LQVKDNFRRRRKMRMILTLVTAALVLGSFAGVAVAYDNGYGDAEIPTTFGGCSDAVGCHSRNSTGTISLSAAADDGTWDTPGELGSITVTVNIDAVADDDSIPGVALIDPATNGNIKASGWNIISDPNSNPACFNYNERSHVSGDESFAWHVNAPSSAGTYRVLARVFYGRERYNQDTITVVLATAVAEGRSHEIPGQHVVLKTSPNPFRHHANITCSIPEDGHFALRAYDASGRLVRIIVDRDAKRGSYSLEWDGRDDSGTGLAEGVYFLKLGSAGRVTVAKAILIR
jgi:hypothetical protein